LSKCLVLSLSLQPNERRLTKDKMIGGMMGCNTAVSHQTRKKLKFELELEIVACTEIKAKEKKKK